MKVAASEFWTAARHFISDEHRLSKWLGYGILVILVGLFFLDKTPLRNFFYLFVLFPMVRYLRRDCLQEIARSYFWWLTMALCALWAVSVAWSYPFTLEQGFDALRLALIVALFFTGAVRVAQLGYLPTRRIVRAILVTAAVTACVTIAYRWANGAFSDPAYRLVGIGFAANPVLGASLHGFAATLAVLVASGTQAWRQWMVCASVVGLCVTYMVLSGSRGPILAFGVALVVLAFVRSLRFVGVVLLVAAVVGGITHWLGVVDYAEWVERGSNSRIEIWRRLLEESLQHPIFGHGAADVIDVTSAHINSAHNIFIANFYHLGLLGLAIFVALSVYACVHTVSLARRGDIWPLVMFAYGYTIMCLDTQAVIIAVSREWLIFWFPILMLVARESRHALSLRRLSASATTDVPPSTG